MLGFSAIEIGGLILLVYFAVYGVINRICKCIEHCATGKAVRECGMDISKMTGVDTAKEDNDVEKIKK